MCHCCCGSYGGISGESRFDASPAQRQTIFQVLSSHPLIPFSWFSFSCSPSTSYTQVGDGKSGFSPNSISNIDRSECCRAFEQEKGGYSSTNPLVKQVPTENMWSNPGRRISSLIDVVAGAFRQLASWNANTMGPAELLYHLCLRYGCAINTSRYARYAPS